MAVVSPPFADVEVLASTICLLDTLLSWSPPLCRVFTSCDSLSTLIAWFLFQALWSDSVDWVDDASGSRLARCTLNCAAIGIATLRCALAMQVAPSSVHDLVRVIDWPRAALGAAMPTMSATAD